MIKQSESQGEAARYPKQVLNERARGWSAETGLSLFSKVDLFSISTSPFEWSITPLLRRYVRIFSSLPQTVPRLSKY